MRAVVIPEYGGVEVLEVRDVPDPVPGPDEALVEVVCSAMNRADGTAERSKMSISRYPWLTLSTTLRSTED